MREEPSTNCDICGCEHDATNAGDNDSLHLCAECTWTELHIVRRPLKSSTCIVR